MFSFEDVYEAASALPRSQRAELVELLVADIKGEDESAFDFARKEGLDGLGVEIDAGTDLYAETGVFADVGTESDEVIPWDEVRRRVSARLTSDD